jgi:WD40 repeat protein/DNA-binding SARP family transcriptional activator
VTPVEFRLLGPLEVVDSGRPLELGGPKQRAVLACLLLRANHVVPADRLIDEVWGEDPPPSARNVLQTYVSRLRRSVGKEVVEARAGGYLIRVDLAEVDAFRFEQLVDHARSATGNDPLSAVQSYRSALGLWRGPVLDDLRDQVSLGSDITRLEELRVAAIEEWARLELALGRHSELVPEIEALTALHPLREKLWGYLILALYRSGRQGDALAAFQTARRVLSDELGVDPGTELQRLHEHVLAQDATLELPGERIRGYRVLEQVGEGAFGEVFRASQPYVSRDVAVKVIHRHLANDPEFIRRFETEAQLVARLEHPHIVPLYDYWREPSGAYLVMRFLRGGSLREALTGGPLVPAKVAAITSQVAQALVSAHRRGVVHRDVKPANILFDEEGNAYLSDFGIAKELAAAQTSSRGGTPSPFLFYLSPEEVRGHPPTTRADIYSLGVVVYEMLAGRHPYADTPADAIAQKHLREPLPSLASIGLPPSVDEIVARATAKDPEARFPDASALSSALQVALGDGALAVAPVVTEARNPYKGIAPFLEADAADFFGREVMVARLLARMRRSATRLLVVAGPSGSGKSSLVRAGLVPAVRQGGLPGSEQWFVVEMVPGQHPFLELAQALLRVASEETSLELAQEIEGSEHGLGAAVERILPGDGSELLLVIDQLEELFTLVEREDVRARFIANVVRAATDPSSRMRVVATIRADFYDRPLLYRGLAELVREETEVVVPLDADELQRAVTGPAERVGVSLEPGLVAQLVADVAGEPGSLPLLQFALTELFERRKGPVISLEAYREIGGVTSALARAADETFLALPEAAQEATRQLFLRLVTLDEAHDTRRRVLRAELTALQMEAGPMEAALEAFGGARLLSFDRDPQSRAPTVEVAHEALLREWQRFRGWIDAAREDLRTERRIDAAAREWRESGRNPSFLASGSRLERFETIVEGSAVAIAPDEREFVEASIAERESQRAEEAARLARERSLERRSLRRLRGLVAVLALAAVVATALTFTAARERGRAEREARLAVARELAAAAVVNLDVDPERSILLALQAVDATWQPDDIVLPEAEEALHRALKRSRVVLTVPQGGGLGVMPNGNRFGTTAPDGTATVWDAGTGERIFTVDGHEGDVTGITASPDGRLMATTGTDRTTRLWHAGTGRAMSVLRGSDSVVLGSAFSPDGRRLVTKEGDGTLRIWRVATGKEESALRGPPGETFDRFGISAAPVFSPDGTRVASGGWGAEATVWDVTSGKIAMRLTHDVFVVTDVAFSPDGHRLATATIEGIARTWDTQTGKELATFSGHAGELNSIAFSPDGRRIATAGTDGTARLWNATTGEHLMTLVGHSNGIRDVAFTSDGDRLITSGLDDTTRVWDVTARGSRDWLTVTGPKLRMGGVAFSPDGSTFAVPNRRGPGVTVRESDSGQTRLVLKGHPAIIARLAYSPDGTLLAGTDSAGVNQDEANWEIPIWDTDTGELVHVLKGHTADVVTSAFSADGTKLVTSSYDGTLRIWDLASGTEEASLDIGIDAFGLGFSADDRYLLAGTRSSIRVWDATDLEELDPLEGHEDWIQALAFGRDGMVASVSFDGTTRIWDIEARRELARMRGHSGPVVGVAFSPDGTTVATSGMDGTTKLWDVATGRERITLYGHSRLVHTVAFSPDGRFLATASGDGTVALHLLPIESLRELAQTRVTRTLTEAECLQYLHRERCA